MTDIFDDLAAEYAALDEVLAGLTDTQWAHSSAAAGWSVADVVLHLAQSEELAQASVAGRTTAFERSGQVDAAADDLVAAQRGGDPREILARWRAAALPMPAALRAVPKGTRLTWVAAPLSAPTLATTRLAEHWAHALDITAPLAIPYPDTARLRHIAWLAHRMLPYAFATEGLEGGPVSCTLTAPTGETWTYGDPAAPSSITGPAPDFCRVGAHRLAPSDSALTATGPHGAQALSILRTYAV